MVFGFIFRWRRRVRQVTRAADHEVVRVGRVEIREQVSFTVEQHRMRGRCWVIDGDTIKIRDTRIRLAGIDAPELDQAWGEKAKWALFALCKGQEVTAIVHARDPHGRLIATCLLSDGRDLGAEMVKLGLALDWPLFSQGKYRHLEPSGARRKLRFLHVGQSRYGLPPPNSW